MKTNNEIEKYKKLIENINSKIKKPLMRNCSLHKEIYAGYLFGSINDLLDSDIDNAENTELALIYNYSKLNSYAKVIMDKSQLTLIDPKTNQESWLLKHRVYSELYEENMDSGKKISVAKDFINLCREDINIDEGYKFIFWSLMILTVDKQEADKHLALICQFAYLLGITIEEFNEIIDVIINICNENEVDYVYNSEKVQSIFGSIYDLFCDDDYESLE